MAAVTQGVVVNGPVEVGWILGTVGVVACLTPRRPLGVVFAGLVAQVLLVEVPLVSGPPEVRSVAARLRHYGVKVVREPLSGDEPHREGVRHFCPAAHAPAVALAAHIGTLLEG